MPNEVIRKLKEVKNDTGMFDWLNYNYTRVKAVDMPIINKNDQSSLKVYKIFHFSSRFHRTHIQAQGQRIRTIILNSL